MRKILISLLAVSSGYAVASHRVGFQQFDNQYNLGYGYNEVTVQNGNNTAAQIDNQTLNLEVERLFDVGVWMDAIVNMNLQSSTNQSGGMGGQTNGIQPWLTQDPNFVSLNAKVGYAFEVVTNHLQITPYLTLGRNSNLMASTVAYANNGAYHNIAQDYYLTMGVGGRLEYRINRAIDLYLDQLVNYNWDQSNPGTYASVGSAVAQNTMLWTTTLGAKFNIVKNLQLGINGFYTSYQQLATAPNDIGALGASSGVGIYRPNYAFGGMINVGLTY